MNNYAVSSDGIATALQDSASALMEGGNNLEQATALVAAANRVVQDPNSVGSALRTISLRLRGTSVEILEEMGEETDGVVESVSKLQEKIKALTGVDILTDTGAYKDTYTILKEIGSAWKDISDIDKAAALELMAGKNRANVLSAILNNMKDLEGAYESALKAEGSAMQENATHLASIQGRIELFNNAVQTMWMNFMDDNALKFIIDAGTLIIKLIDKIGLLETALGAFFGFQVAKSSIKTAFKEIEEGTYSLTNAIKNQTDATKASAAADIAASEADKLKTTTQNAENASQEEGVAAGKAETAQDRATSAQDIASSEADTTKTATQNAENIAQQENVVAGQVEAAQDKITSAQDLASSKIDSIKTGTQNAENGSQTSGGLSSGVGSAVGGAVAGGAIKTGLSAGASKLGAFAIGGLKGILVALGISLVTKLLGKILEPVGDWITDIFKSTEDKIAEATTALEASIDKCEEAVESFRSVKSSADDVIPRFTALAKGVDNLGNNVGLSAKEYDEFWSLNNKLAEMFPELNMGMDSNGNAMLSLSYSANTLQQSLWDLVEAQRAAANEKIADTMPDVIDNIKDINDINVDELESLQSALSNYKKTIKEVNYWYDDERKQAAKEAFGKDEWQEQLMLNADLQLNGTVPQMLKELVESTDNLDLWQELLDKYTRIIDGAKIIDWQSLINDDAWDNVVAGLEKKIVSVQDKISAQWTDLNPVVTAWIQTEYEYNELSDDMQSIVQAMVSGVDFSQLGLETEEEVKQYIKDHVLIPIDDLTPDANNALSELLNLNPKDIPAQEYIKQLQQLIDRLKRSAPDLDINAILAGTGQDDTINQYDKAIVHLSSLMTGKTGIETAERLMQRDWFDDLSMDDLLLIYYNISAEPGSYTIDQLKEELAALKKEQGTDVIPVQTYSSLVASTEALNEAQKQTAEIILNNTEVTQEYKDSLKELGISEDELNECFYEGNPLIVKNANALNKLVKSAKQNTAQNVKYAKSQAMLQYYELYKKIRSLTNGEADLARANLAQIKVLYNEMNLVQQSIVKYGLLEQELLGAANAYEKFADAQEADAATDYMSSAEEMLTHLGQAFNTAELGTESARTAIMGLVPESVYADLDTVDEKIATIYDYFKNGKLSQYFDITWDEDGNIENAEMKLGNLRKFIEDGLVDDGANVFDGTDWMHFTLSDVFLKQLEELPEGADKLQLFADKMNVTKEVALAFLKSLEDHDVEWLGGDYSSLLDMFSGLESKIYNTTKDLATLEMQLASGKTTPEEYAKTYQELSGSLRESALQAKDNILQYQDLTTQIEDQKKVIDEYTAKVKGLKDQGKSDEEVKASVEYNSLIEASKLYTDLIQKRATLSQPTELLIQAAVDVIDQDLETIEDTLKEKIDFGEDGTYTIKVGVELTEAEVSELERYKKLWEDRHKINVETDPEETKTALQEIEDAAQNALDVINSIDGTTITINTSSAVSSVDNLRVALEKLAGVESTEVQVTKPVGSTPSKVTFGPGSKLATKHFAMYADGTQSAPRTEEALVGELGTEVLVRNGKWYTVGENGAEFTQVRRGDIIFNHKQSEELLKNGHTASRGKAFASGTAYNTIFAQGSSKTQWEGTGYSSWDDPTYDLNEALNSAADSVEEFEETIDWIEIRMEELSEQLSLYSAKLENNLNDFDKNSTIDAMISINKAIQENARAGAAYYEKHAQQYLVGMSDVLVAAAKNGAISIQEFTKTEDEATVNAIQKYREFIQKAADLTQQVEETVTEIRNLELQQIENSKHSGEVRASIEDKQTDKLQWAVDYDEARGLITDPKYYAEMMENSSKSIEYLTNARQEMQKDFNDAMSKGLFTNDDGSYNDLFYEELEKLYDIDSQIDDAVASLEDFQNAINDIYWASFDEFINRLDYIDEETQSLIDLMDSADMFTKPNKPNGWGDSDVAWTDEGFATLGLHAQKLERAEERAKAYGVAINDLTAEYNAGHYSESEYYEKLNELTQGRYDAIEAAEDEKKAIVELNEARIDEVKNGINKQIEAYEELINKKKEELSAEKDLHDFQKGVQEQQKDIASIQRKLAALSADNSASAVAQRKKLEAELAEANAALEETYYDRSIENKQNALDKELEDFQNEKDAEIERLEQYLENVEQVVADSLSVVQANATAVSEVLTSVSEEYGLKVDPAITEPWKHGMLAIDEYTTKFGDTSDKTVAMLDSWKVKWQEIKDAIAEANLEADKHLDHADDYHSLESPSVEEIKKENESYHAATPSPTPTPAPNPAPTTPDPDTAPKAAPTVGNSVTVKKSATHFGSKSKKKKMAPYVPGGKYTVYQVSKDGSQILIGRKGVYTGWVNKTDLEGYASGTTGVKNDQFAWIDEMGLEEIVLHADGNGKLAYLSKGSAVLPHDISENLMQLGSIDPQDMLDRNRPAITAPHIVNNEVKIDISYGDMVSIGEYNGGDIKELERMVAKQFEQHTKDLNNALKRFTR